VSKIFFYEYISSKIPACKQYKEVHLMGKKDKVNEEYKNNYGVNLENCVLLGEGNHGKVYIIAADRVIKICKDSKSCIFEAFILTRTSGSKYFPKIYDYDEHYIVRDYVGGETLTKYIKENGINKEIIISLIELLEEFVRLGFTKLDIRCRDLMIQPDGNIIVIDPKSSYTRKMGYPRHLMKGLKKIGALDEFINTLKQERPDLYEMWKENAKSKDIKKKRTKEGLSYFDNDLLQE
jgi:predicted Ser/Thr protein kinase